MFVGKIPHIHMFSCLFPISQCLTLFYGLISLVPMFQSHLGVLSLHSAVNFVTSAQKGEGWTSSIYPYIYICMSDYICVILCNDIDLHVFMIIYACEQHDVHHHHRHHNNNNKKKTNSACWTLSTTQLFHALVQLTNFQQRFLLSSPFHAPPI